MKKLLPWLILLLLLSACAPTQTATLASRNVFYAGGESKVKTALTLAGYTLVNDPQQAEVLVLNGEIPATGSGQSPDAAGMAEQVKNGMGLVLIPGKETSQADIQTLLGQSVIVTAAAEAVSLIAVEGIDDPLLTEIAWNGAPQVRERSVVQGLSAGAREIVSTYETGEGILWQVSGRTFLLTPWLSDEANPQIQEWGYFNYLIYHLVERAAGGEPVSFASYPAAPIPHGNNRNALFLFLGLELLFFFSTFIIIRRYSVRHPEALDSLVADREKYEANEEHTDWEKPGFHRPLSGLFVGMAIGILLFIPLIAYQNFILPQFILPSAQALGMWGRVTQFFGLTWAIWDLGTSTASMKFLSQYRVSDPRRGFKYMQVYVWWQALSGAIQVALVVALTSIGIVRTPYALFAWSIVIHSLIQIPGFYGVFRGTLNALQRNDYARYIDAAWAIVLPVLTQLAIVPIFYAYGKSHPALGASMGGVIGLGAAAYALELVSFLLGFWLYKRLGYKASILFMAHFDWGIIKETFKFGFFEMLGGILVAGGAALEIWVTQNGLVNYSETWGNWLLAWNFLLAFTVSTNLFDGVMPAVSEALSSGYKMLSQYYSVQSYKWGSISSAVLAAVLLVAAPKFIIGSSGQEFQRAAVIAIPLTIFGAIQFLGWLGDAIFLGSNKPLLRALLILLEQTIRIGLMLLLLERFQIMALLIAYIIAILVRGISAYFVADRYCFPQRFYSWQSLAAPSLAAVAQYFFLRLIASVIWKNDEVTSILLLFVALVPCMPVFFFFYALAGGWDDAGLEETVQASHMVGFLRPVIQVIFILPSRWGARISPLHNRFPISMRPMAMEEARLLADEKVKLVKS